MFQTFDDVQRGLPFSRVTIAHPRTDGKENEKAKRKLQSKGPYTITHSVYTLGDSWSDLEYFAFPQTAHVIDSEVDSEVDGEMMAVDTLGDYRGPANDDSGRQSTHELQRRPLDKLFDLSIKHHSMPTLKTPPPVPLEVKITENGDF